MNSMFINGIDIETFDLILTKVPPIVKPQKRLRRIAVPGRSGHLTEWAGDYESYVKSPDFVYTGDSIDEALSLLQAAYYITFPNEPDVVYDVQAERIDAELQPSGIYKITTSYITQPLKRQETEMMYSGATSYTVLNIGTEQSYPKIVVTGAGEQTVTIGSATLTIAFAVGGETITIDSLNGQVYDSAGANAWSKLTGDLPVLPVGQTTVSTTGSVLTVYPNWRWA